MIIIIIVTIIVGLPTRGWRIKRYYHITHCIITPVTYLTVLLASVFSPMCQHSQCLVSFYVTLVDGRPYNI